MHIADAQPQVVLVFAVLLTVMIGFEEGMAWAFVGGIFVDLLAFRPLGTTVFSLLLVVGIAAAAVPLVIRVRIAGALVGVALATPLFILLTTVTTGLIRPPSPSFRLGYVAASIVANLILAALAAPLLAWIRRRWDQRRHLTW